MPNLPLKIHKQNSHAYRTRIIQQR